MASEFYWYNWIYFNQTSPPTLIETNKLSLKIGTSIIFVNLNNEVLLLLRDNIKEIPYPGCWDVLGGNLDEGESPKECIIREMEEEIELQLIDPEPFKTYVKYDRIEYTFWKDIELNLHEVNLHEGQKLQWFSKYDIEAIPENCIAFEFKGILLDFYNHLNAKKQVK